MGNFQGKLDFLKFKNSCVISVKGKTGEKKGVFVPIEDNDIFVTTDENNKAKGAYFNFAVFENKQVGKYGDTHMIKQSIGKDARLKMSDEEKRAIPILGNMKPMELQNVAKTVETPVAPVVHEEDDDSLPF